MAKKKKEIRDMSRDQLIDHVEVLKKNYLILKLRLFLDRTITPQVFLKLKKI